MSEKELREALREFLNVISAAEALGWTFAGGSTRMKAEHPITGDLYSAHAKLAVAATEAAAVPEPARNVERLVELVTLVRAGFLVEVGGNRTTVADVAGEPYRSLLMTILGAPDSATAAARLSDPSNG